MSRWRAWSVLALWLAAGCSLGGESVRAAEPHLEEFSTLRVRALPLAQMRRDLRKQQSLFEAFKSHGPSPAGLEAELKELEQGRISLSQADLDRAQEEFKRRFEAIFQSSEGVVHAELVFIDEGGTSTYLYPEDTPSPVTGRWQGLRQPRTFSALADCTVDGQPVSCVVVQLRPLPHPGTAGLTVAFARE